MVRKKDNPAERNIIEFVEEYQSSDSCLHSECLKDLFGKLRQLSVILYKHKYIRYLAYTMSKLFDVH